MYDGSVKDVDYVLTTREICRLIKAEQIDVFSLPEEEFDSPLGESTGAGIIFGATGGVMEAALRTGYHLVMGKNPDPDAFSAVRGMDGWKEAEFRLGGTVLRTAVASGLGNTRRLINAIRRGEASYDFVEIMACPGGCAGGGGQPTAGKRLQTGAKLCIRWIRKILSASPMKTTRFRNFTEPTSESPVPIWRTGSSTQITAAGRCRVKSRLLQQMSRHRQTSFCRAAVSAAVSEKGGICFGQRRAHPGDRPHSVPVWSFSRISLEQLPGQRSIPTH